MRTIFPNISSWSERLPGLSPSFYLAQLLTGYGCLRKYLFDKGRATSPNCLWCPGFVEDVKHAIFESRRLTIHRTEIVRSLGHGLVSEDVAEPLCNPSGLVVADDGVVGGLPVAEVLTVQRLWVKAILSDRKSRVFGLRRIVSNRPLALDSTKERRSFRRYGWYPGKAGAVDAPPGSS